MIVETVGFIHLCVGRLLVFGGNAINTFLNE